MVYLFFLKQKTADEMRISDWSLYVCSSDLGEDGDRLRAVHRRLRAARHGRGRHGRGRPGALGMDGAGDRVDDTWRTAPRPAELVDVLAAGAAGTRGVDAGVVAAAAVSRQLSVRPYRTHLGGKGPQPKKERTWREKGGHTK